MQFAFMTHIRLFGQCPFKQKCGQWYGLKLISCCSHNTGVSTRTMELTSFAVIGTGITLSLWRTKNTCSAMTTVIKDCGSGSHADSCWPQAWIAFCGCPWASLSKAIFRQVCFEGPSQSELTSGGRGAQSFSSCLCTREYSTLEETPEHAHKCIWGLHWDQKSTTPVCTIWKYIQIKAMYFQYSCLNNYV